MAERFKALQSGRSPLAWALVRIPLLTMYLFQSFFEVKNFMQGKPILAGWPSDLRRCVQVAVHFCGRGHFLRLKNFMQGKPILGVRMAERSEALRSGRSPLLWAWVPKLNVRENLSPVRMAERSKALRFDHIPLLWARAGQAVKGAAFMSKSSGFGVGNTLPRVSMAERSKALRSGRSPLLWAWAGQAVKGAAFKSQSTSGLAWSFLRLKNFMQGKPILGVRMAERSEALRSGRSPLLWAWAGQAVKGAAFMSKSSGFGVGWPSGLRRCVQVTVHLCGVGLNPTFDNVFSIQSFFEVKELNARDSYLRVRMAERFKALQSGRSPLAWA
ncbi:hypothetical protein TNCV_4801601 [Trichonephila clavipes]|nr:hypothetical protein TNCV_4801601 [Trichonephila clavipes]